MDASFMEPRKANRMEGGIGTVVLGVGEWALGPLLLQK